MSYQILWDEKALGFIRKINKPEAQRIIKKINSISSDPQHYLETLVEIRCYKLRVGDYRILIDLDENKEMLYIRLIGHRKDIYKYVQRRGIFPKNS